ncbi:hypothetical protein GCM10007425_25130 [Lysinibacillus alkalisoli]|uniref:DUF1963 domain-containing protein n=1 Tax=Lysinibacillus alkalisoli TaxID=1911548 RepID=A0A917LJ38_9BACI|nr:YwqG family protein [Lysinibacillus alkalisoli]GGG29475.1 hypothetical protein GCM10007425_25130 [Lysinibacillus alkalisoli]
MNAQQVVQQFKEKYAHTKREAVAIEVVKGEATRWQSKFGGEPYWPISKPYPQTKEGEPLLLLAQFVLADLPHLPVDFPKTGILQFFIASDDVYGCEFGEHIQDGYRVVYHEDVEANLLEDVPSNLAINEYEFPFKQQYALRFELQQELISLSDHRMIDDYDDMDDATWDILHDHFIATGHKLGGYPFFTQCDPRAHMDHLKEYELLFQLDSDMDHDIMWGDVGVGNFFIHPTDLKNKDFTKVLYTWDCH